MGEPGTCASDSPGRQTAVGAADLEKLLQTAEAENLQMVKLIDTEKQKYAAFQKQMEETVAQTEALEESTKRLDVEAKQLHNKFKQNREICEGLRKTATVLDEHEESLRKKLETVTLEQQTQISQQEKVIEKYEKIWGDYLKKYESMPLAMELSQLKQTAMNSEIFVKEATEEITKIQSQIIEMEVEKTHMQEYLQGNPETANDSIIKIATLFLDIEKSATKAKMKLSELKELRAEMTSATKKQAEPKEKNVVSQANRQTVLQPEQNNENQGHQETGISRKETQDTNQQDQRDQNDNMQEIGDSIPSSDNQSNERTLDTTATTEYENVTQPTNQTKQISTLNQIPLLQTPKRTQSGLPTESQRRDSEPTTNKNNHSTRLPQISTPLVSSLRLRQEETGRPTSELRESPEEQESRPVSSTSHVPATPIISSASSTIQSESTTPGNAQSTTPGNDQSASTTTTPVHQPELTTPVRPSPTNTSVPQSTRRSPLDLSQHIKFLRQVTKSPGEGFMYRGRSMYSSNQVQVSGQAEATTEQNEPEVIYDAPLNDQAGMSLNFFQPFTQQGEKTNQSLFQKNTEPSPETNRNILLQSPSASSATSSPRQGFSFNLGNASPRVGESSFLPSNSPGGIFGKDKNQSEGDNFSSGFSLFGSSNSSRKDTEDNSGGFSFSFGSKSPQKSSGSSSGFCLF